jgi:hypothetical protein
MASLSSDDCCFNMAGIKIFASEPGYTHTGMRPNSELFRLEWSQVQLEASEFMPNGYIRVKESKIQSAERILPLTPRAWEVLLILRIEHIKDGASKKALALGVSWSRQFTTFDYHPRISSRGDPKRRPGFLSALLVPAPVWRTLCREWHGSAPARQIDGVQLSQNYGQSHTVCFLTCRIWRA